MAGDDTSLPTRVIVRKLTFTLVGVFVFAAGLTLMYESMRAVMDVGGSCGSGGPYVVRQECPDGAGLIVVGIFAALLGTGLVVAGTFRNGPQLWVFAWPALFIALGWNFLVYGLDPPPPEEGLVWGWLICAVLFFLMGGVPLLFVLWKPKVTFWGGLPTPGAAPVSPAPAARSTVPRFGDTTVPTVPMATTIVSPPRSNADPSTDDDLVSDLERLSTLHRAGQLTDAEFARAKATLLDEEGA